MLSCYCFRRCSIPGLLSRLAQSGEAWNVKDGQEGHSGGGPQVGHVVGDGQVVCIISGSHGVHSSHGWQQLSHGSGSGHVSSIVGTVCYVDRLLTD